MMLALTFVLGTAVLAAAMFGLVQFILMMLGDE